MNKDSLNKLPTGFVYVSSVIPNAVIDARYYSENNFVGKRIDGYNAPVVVISELAAVSLKKASDDFNSLGYKIKIFDAYRPQRAVNHFVKWAKDVSDTKTKSAFYPSVDKSKLFELEYINEKSSHSRGSTVDLSLVSMKSGKEIDMGSPFDFFGEISHHGTPLITIRQTANRNILRDIMLLNGFWLYLNEWWHYTLINEPYPNTYFDFPIA